MKLSHRALSFNLNQEKINIALSNYAKLEKNKAIDFNDSIRKQIKEKQAQIDNYMTTLGSGILPNEVIADIGNKIVDP